jgi:chloramphenicol-sensitive protein RarD
LVYLGLQDQNAFLHANWQTQLWIAAAGPITAIPLLLFAAGARRIPMATLGLLQYISPSIQLLIGVLLFNEKFGQERLLGFLGIWIGLLIYSIDGLRFSLQQKPVEPPLE